MYIVHTIEEKSAQQHALWSLGSSVKASADKAKLLFDFQYYSDYWCETTGEESFSSDESLQTLLRNCGTEYSF